MSTKTKNMYTENQVIEMLPISCKTKKGEPKKQRQIKMAIELLTTGKVYTTYTTGSGKWSHTEDLWHLVRVICDEMGIAESKIEFRNDAPRGGKSGNHFVFNF